MFIKSSSLGTASFSPKVKSYKNPGVAPTSFRTSSFPSLAWVDHISPEFTLPVVTVRDVASSQVISPKEGLGEMDGLIEGERDGLLEGEREGLNEGERDGDKLTEGLTLGEIDGERLGDFDGLIEGDKEGDKDGDKLGDNEGLKDGLKDPADGLGLMDGESDGDKDGEREGEILGDKEGESETLGETEGLILGLKLGERLGEIEGEKEVGAVFPQMAVICAAERAVPLRRKASSMLPVKNWIFVVKNKQPIWT